MDTKKYCDISIQFNTFNMKPSPITVTTTTEVADGETRVTSTKSGTTISTVCVVMFGDPSQENNGLRGDYPYWDQPVQDRIDEFTVDGTYNFIGVINVQNKRLFSMKFPTLEIMQMGMEKAGRRYGFQVPNFDTSKMDLLENKIDHIEVG